MPDKKPTPAEDFLKYSKHLRICDINRPPRHNRINRCDCGFNAALARARRREA